MKTRWFYAGALFALIAGLGFLSVLFVQDSAEATPPEEAQDIINDSGVQGGIIVHLNCRDGSLTEALSLSDGYLVHGLDPGAENIQTARRNILSKHKYGPVSVDQLLDDRLPYRDNLVNLLVADDLGSVPMDEVMRVLAPCGVAMIRGTLGWGKTVKPWPPEMDEWNQYLYNAGGNPVSKDEAISPIKHYQWIGSPRWARHHDTTASMSAMVSAGDSLFVAGPPDVVDEEAAFFALDDEDVLALLAEQSAVLEGKEGALLWAVSAGTGEKVAEYRLDSLPVWDGLVAADGNLYLTTMSGDTICYSNYSRGVRQRPRSTARPKLCRKDTLQQSTNGLSLK